MFEWLYRLFGRSTKEMLEDIREPIIMYDFVDEKGVRQVWDLNAIEFKYNVPEGKDESK